MPEITSKVQSSCSVHAVVTRADGRKEDLGLISYTSRNPLRRLIYALGKLLGIWRR